MFSTIRYYCGNRLFEWVMTVAMLGVAVEIILWPNTIKNSDFHFILQIIGTQMLGLCFLIGGAVRCIALVSNGRWPSIGPKLRAITAAGAASVWWQMDIALFMAANGNPSPGIPLYFAITVGELISCYRALTDARPRSGT